MALLFASTVTACALSSRPQAPTSPPETGPVARLWQQSAAARDFERFTRDGTLLAPDGTLELDATAARPGTDPFPAGGWSDGGTYANGGSFVFGTATSEHTIPGGFDSVVPSFDALTPPGTWVRVTLAARVAGAWTTDYDLGVWASDRDTVSRHSVDGQVDDHGKVSTDTLLLRQQADALRMTIWLYSAKPGVSPRVRALAAAVSHRGRTPVDGPSDRKAWGTVLAVPGYSQMPYPGGNVWCSPTSTTMLLAYWGQKLSRDDLAEPVPAAADHTFDWVYQGTGNWSFNTAYAAARGDGALHALAARLDSFAQVEQLITTGIPVSISIAYEEGTLTGSPVRRSDGHLLVVKGFTAQGDVICNDPAFPSDDKVEVTYRRDELWRAWRHSGGLAYVLWPAGTRLPEGAVSLVP